MKAFRDLEVGDFIADMHYGIGPVAAQFDVVSHVRWDEPRLHQPARDGYPEHAFFRYLDEFMPGGYVNKCLHVIGHGDDGSIVAGYCYDGRRSGIVVLKEKA